MFLVTFMTFLDYMYIMIVYCVISTYVYIRYIRYISMNEKNGPNTKIKPLSISITDIEYLQEQGIGRSEFFRQSVQAWKDGKFIYDRSRQ